MFALDVLREIKCNLKEGHKVEMFGSSNLLADIVEPKFPYFFVMLLRPPGSHLSTLSNTQHHLLPLLEPLSYFP